jgi:bacteriorhodopsin
LFVKKYAFNVLIRQLFGTRLLAAWLIRIPACLFLLSLLGGNERGAEICEKEALS